LTREFHWEDRCAARRRYPGRSQELPPRRQPRRGRAPPAAGGPGQPSAAPGPDPGR